MRSPETPTTQPLVLIADDDELMRSLISASLRERGFDTVEVANGRDAVTLLERVTPDLVILDVQMPVLDGFAACGEIRSTPKGADVPIVIVTGTDDTDSVEQAFEVGATDFISKPVNWSLLGHRMRYVLRGAETRRDLIEREAENSALLQALPDRLVLVKASGEILNLLENESRQETASRDFSGEFIDVLLPKDSAATAKRIIEEVVTTQAEGIFEFRGPNGPPASAGTAYEARVVPQTENIALMIIRDVTEKKAADARMHKLAYYDTLTDLPNRHYFLQVIGEAMLNDRSQTFALFSLDLDQFKRINDTLGHETGDAVLLEIANRLSHVKQQLHATGCYAELARLSGDEFVFLTGMTSEAHLRDVMQQLDTALRTPIEAGQQQIVVTASIGIASYPNDGNSVQTLLMNAAQALTAAKQAGGNTYAMFDHIRQESPADLLKLEFELRSAIDNNGLELHFQPKYRLADGSLYGAEALLRWQHPERGPISPGVFIPIAERSGLIIDIDRWVTDRACQHLLEWQLAGRKVVPVSINLSGRAFSYDRPSEFVARALSTRHIDPSLLEIEITETVLMADAEQAAKTLAALKNMGISLAIDDFGTGYSSLSYLKRFPLDVLKIDRAFIEELETDPNDQALCHAMISMAHGLGLKVVAEGIETQFQHDFLRAAGCEFAQGFLLDRPMRAADFSAKLLTLTEPYAFNPQGSVRSDNQSQPPDDAQRH